MEQLKQQIQQILFDLVRDIRMHKIDADNSIFEVDYDVAIEKIISLINEKADHISDPPNQ